MKKATARQDASRSRVERPLVVGPLAILGMLVIAVTLPVQAAQLDNTVSRMHIASGAGTSLIAPHKPLPLRHGTVQRGQSSFVLLRQAGASAAAVIKLQKATRSVYDIRLLRVGQPYSIEVTTDGQVRRFVYEIDTQHRLTVERRGQTFTARLEPIEYEYRERLVQGTIHGSLYDVLTAHGETPKIATDMGDIFAWNVDFRTDLRSGDTFHLLIEERYRDGKRIGYHRILAAELVNRRRVIQAVYYPPDKADGVYYRPDGRAMHRMFLRSPLRYTRISSRFSRRRFHPILKRYQPHFGIDYAAPIGTPVRSVADGVVAEARRKGASGNMIEIRHDRAYSTSYLHLSRFARGVRAGKRVSQGQIIGYVGSTGRSTGPHLDFRLTRYGKYLNPLRLRNVEGPPLPSRTLPMFRTYAKRVLAKLPRPATTGQRVAARRPDAR